MELAHEGTGQGVALVHRHDNSPRVSRGQQGGEGAQEHQRQPARLNVALLGAHQLLGEGLLQRQRELAGGGAVPARVHFQREYL